ncbi:molybdopterin molybdotransferase [Marinospirillum celere]|uniref:Molybdopterin molybdenumtransferase n=1 Tax=Marinospirillum celere TaxID=1122252 RepID=A0A1I1JR48_9GAMM|nr:gephyrin-like molybdotransferase Glp [Marinospirillum celere]SFC51034.1 molybdopterin molybdotransferase [Marinospirillum celere]
MSLSCFDFAEGKAQLTLEEAQQALLETATEITPAQERPLQESLGLHLAEAIRAPLPVPQNTNSAMDGYALRGSELGQHSAWKLAGECLAGQGYDQPLQAGECVYITTGAPLPEGADTVIMLEQAQLKGDQVSFQLGDKPLQTGSNVRLAGEDIQQDQPVMAAGQLLGSVQLGLLASLGLSRIQVHQPLKVAIFSTGDEVTAPGLPLHKAGIYDANRFSLLGLLKGLGCQITDLGILPDDLNAITQALRTAAQDHQLVLTSGGVSVGDADFVKQALHQLGETRFWRLALRPGRPFAFGHLGQNRQGQTCLFAGLPGNPVAVMVIFMLLVQPLIRKLQGGHQNLANTWIALAEEPMKSRRGRSDFHRGIYTFNSQGQLTVTSTGAQGSGILTSMHLANCLIRIRDDQAEVAVGQPVAIYPFHLWLPEQRCL